MVVPPGHHPGLGRHVTGPTTIRADSLLPAHAWCHLAF
jgi:hypothetical protein